VNRVVARVAADGTVDTTTALASAFSGASGTNANARAAITDAGTSYWVVGAGTGTSGGIWQIPHGTTTATQITGQSGNGPSAARSCGIRDGQLYASTNVAPFCGVFTVGTGLPTTMAAATILPGFPTSGTSSPIDFVILDCNADVPGADTIYVGDDRSTASGGGIQKWTRSDTTWTLAYTLKTGLATGIRQVLAVETATDVQLFGVTTSTPNAIVKFVDAGSGSAATTLVTAGANTAFRGLALPPVP
jgi:hypothetical protein